MSSKLSDRGETGCVIRAREQKGFESNRPFSTTRMVKARAMALKSDGSGHLQECEGPGAPGGRSAADRMPRPDGEALGATNGGLGGGATEQER